MKKSSTLLFVLVPLLGFSQEINNFYDFKIHQDSNINFIRTEIFEVNSIGLPDKKSDQPLFMNLGKPRDPDFIYFSSEGIVIDSLPTNPGYRMFSMDFYEKGIVHDSNKIFLTLRNNEYYTQIFSLSSKNMSLENINFGNDSLYVYAVYNDTYLAIDQEIGLKLYKFDPRDKTTELIYDFLDSDRFNYNIYEGVPNIEITNIYHFNDEILIQSGRDAGGLSNVSIFKFNIDTKEFTIVTDDFYPLVEEAEKEEYEKYPNLRYVKWEPKISKFIPDFSDTLAYISGSHKHDDFVMDKNFKLIGRSLRRSLTVQGIKFRESNKIEYIRLLSATDSASAEFNFELKYPIEKSCYDIYYGNELNTRMLDILNKYELSILKNMVFAKHNYQFDNPFYQAYFNTFHFYNKNRVNNTRTKDVNNKLTEADIKNLSIINEALQRVGD